MSGDFIIAGVIGEDGVKSVKIPFDKDFAENSNYAHLRNFGQRNHLCWRYRKFTNTVYWYSESSEPEKIAVSDHLLKKHINAAPRHLRMEGSGRLWNIAHGFTSQ